MHTYCKLKTGEILIIWSDNSDYDGTMNCYPLSKKGIFNPKLDGLTTVHEDEIEQIDSNLAVLNCFSLGQTLRQVLEQHKEEDLLDV